MELLQLRQFQLFQAVALFNGILHGLADDGVGVPERHSLHDQVVRQVGGVQVALLRGREHGLAPDLYRGKQLEIRLEALFQRVHRVEQAFLVLLVVPVVSQRLPFHDGQHGCQVAVHPAGLAARQFRHVRVLLLRHDGGTGAEGVVDIDEAESRRQPQHQLFGKPGQVQHDQRRIGAELDDEVPVAHRVQRISCHGGKPQQFGGQGPVDGETRAG